MEEQQEKASSDERWEKTNYLLMVPKIERTCLSVRSALSGKPNVKEVLLGAKLPMIPGSHLVLYTTGLGEKLHRASCDFDRTYPLSGICISNDYRFLHDQHLDYFYHTRDDVMKKLRKHHLLTSDQKVVCSLKEYNTYRQYLKHLDIDSFNKIFMETYEAERVKKKMEMRSAIIKRLEDPDNPINVRISKAKEVRDRMDKVRILKGKKILKKAEEDCEKRKREEEEKLEQKIVQDIKREKEREKVKKIKTFQKKQEELLREEVLFYKRQEDIYRRKEMNDKKKVALRERERKMALKCERKKKFHLLKMAELRQLVEEEAIRRRKNMDMWKNYFAELFKRHHVKFQAAIEEARRRREEADRKFANSLKLRGLSISGLFNPEEAERKRKMKKKVEPQISEEEKTRQYSAKANLVIHNTILISKTILFPMLEAYEKRTAAKIRDIQVPSILRSLLPRVIKSLGAAKTSALESLMRIPATISKPKVAFKHIQLEPFSRFGEHYATSYSSQVLQDIITELANRIAGHLLKYSSNDDNKPLQDAIGERITKLAWSLMNEIIDFGAKEEDGSVMSFEGEESLSTEESLEQKLSCLAQALIEELLGVKSEHEGLKEEETWSEISELAQFVVHSVLSSVVDDGEETQQDEIYRKIETLIADLSIKLIAEVAGGSRGVDETGSAEYAKLEQKISQLALSVVGSVLQNDTESPSPSFASSSAMPPVSQVAGQTIERLLRAINRLASIVGDDASRRWTDQKEINRIADQVTRRAATTCDDTISASIRTVVTMVADNLTSRVPPETGSLTSHTPIETALKVLAEAVVKDFFRERSEDSLEPSDKGSSDYCSPISELAQTVVSSTVRSLKGFDSEEFVRSSNNITCDVIDHSSKTFRVILTSLVEEFMCSISPKKRERRRPNDLESVLSSAVSDIVTDVIATNVFDLIREQPSCTLTDSDANQLKVEVEKLVMDLLKQSKTEWKARNINASLGEAATGVHVDQSNKGILYLPNHKGTKTTSESTIESTSDIDSAISRTTSLLVKDAIAAKVLELIPEETKTDLSRAELEQLRKDVECMVGNILEENDSTSDIDSAISRTTNLLVKDAIAAKVLELITKETKTNLSRAELERLRKDVECMVGNILEKNDSTTDIESTITAAANKLVKDAVTAKVLELIREDSTTNLGRAELEQQRKAVECVVGNILEKNDSSSDVESAITAAASLLVKDAVAAKVFELIQDDSNANLSRAELEQLRKEVECVVGNILENNESDFTSTSSGSLEQSKGAITCSSSEQSALSSAVRAMAASLVRQVLDKTTNTTEGAFTCSSSEESALSSAVRAMAANLVRQVLEKTTNMAEGAFTCSSSEQSELSSAVRAMAASLVRQVLEKTTKMAEGAFTCSSSEESALSSAVHAMAANLVRQVLEKTTNTTEGAFICSSSEESALSSAVRAVAANLVRQVLEKTTNTTEGAFTCSSSEQSALSSAVRAMAANLVRQVLEKTTNTTGITTYSSSEQSALSSGASATADNLVKQVLNKIRSMAEESTLPHAGEHSSPDPVATSHITDHPTTEDSNSSVADKDQCLESNLHHNIGKEMSDYDAVLEMEYPYTRRLRRGMDERKASEEDATFPKKTTKKKAKGSKIYQSFINWKEQLMYTDTEEEEAILTEIAGRIRDRRKTGMTNASPIGRRLGRIQRRPDLDEIAKIELILDKLAEDIVRAEVGQQSAGRRVDLEDEATTRLLVGRLTLALVTALLGLDTSDVELCPAQDRVKPPQSRGRKNFPFNKPIALTPMPSSGLVEDLANEKSFSLPCSRTCTPTYEHAGLIHVSKDTYNMISTVARPSAAIPARQPAVESEEDEDKRRYDHLTRMLMSSTGASARCRSDSPCLDNAKDHPHRIPSASKRKDPYSAYERKPRTRCKGISFRRASPYRMMSPLLRSTSCRSLGKSIDTSKQPVFPTPPRHRRKTDVRVAANCV